MRDLVELEIALHERVDRAAIRYDDGVHAKHRLMRYHDFFVERIQPGERVLDVGCGKGELAYDLAERSGALVTGIDNHKPHLDFARKRFSHPSIEYVEADAVAYVPDEAYDVVVLSNVLEHIERRVDLLRRLLSHARPGRVLIRVPAFQRHWLVPLKRELGLPFFSDPTHCTEYDAESLRSELREAGLDITGLDAVWGELWVEARPIESVSPAR